MNNEIIFDAVYFKDEYDALPETFKNECDRVELWLNCIPDGFLVVGLDDGDLVGRVEWRGLRQCAYQSKDAWRGEMYAHRSQHPERMSANRLVVHHGFHNRGTEDDITDPSFADRVNDVDREYGALAGEQLRWLMNRGSELRFGDHALPSWGRHTVGEYYTKRLVAVKPYMADGKLEATDRMYQLLRTFYPRVVHPLGFAWISEVRYNPRKKHVEAKVLGERWLPVAHQGLDDESTMMLVSRNRFVQWDVTMLRHPQHGTGETFA